MGAEEEGLGGRDMPRPLPLALPGLQSLVLGHMSHQVNNKKVLKCASVNIFLSKKKLKIIRIWPIFNAWLAYNSRFMCCLFFLNLLNSGIFFEKIFIRILNLFLISRDPSSISVRDTGEELKSFYSLFSGWEADPRALLSPVGGKN